MTASITRTEPINVAVQGEGRPVLVLHGLGGDSMQSLALLPVGSPVTLIAPELPGHGERTGSMRTVSAAGAGAESTSTSTSARKTTRTSRALTSTTSILEAQR